MISAIRLFFVINIFLIILPIKTSAQENTQLQCLKEMVSISLNATSIQSPYPQNIKACSFSRSSFLNAYPRSATIIERYRESVRGGMKSEAELKICKEAQINLLHQVYKNSKGHRLLDLDAKSPLSKTLGARAAFDAAYTSEIGKGPVNFKGCSNAMQIGLWTWVLSRINNEAFLDEHIKDPQLPLLMAQHEQTLISTWYIAQHADQNRELQNKVLKLLHDLYHNKGISGRYLAKLTDEILSKEEKKQKFGTFLTCKEGKVVLDPPLENTENIDDLRKKYDLRPIAEILAEDASRCSS